MFVLLVDLLCAKCKVGDIIIYDDLYEIVYIYDDLYEIYL